MTTIIKSTSLVTLFLFLNSISLSQEINANQITIECGNNYFENTETSQPPLIVRGRWCGDSYFWSMISIGDTLAELGFLDNELFTGKALAFDSLDNILARYIFENGFLQRIEQYFVNDSNSELNNLHLLINMKNGIPHGVQRYYSWHEELQIEKSFQEGILNGPFYWKKERGDYGLEPCVETGIYRRGKYEKTSKPCE
jgi:hypothetical protein